ncbi:SDR family NAD(P)-dependent oxidoreductase [Pedobacter sp. SYP-B3415]|uniref:SDR family NAD(P)-dependent oxidoreductase n=1 Tax=Pedobacter sp. SYP-B3415 TaxID=2496641 RepID=UPI00101DA557|nr:3-oxoacyl-ACP reductase family protein [Pedobacter sp. SYP-B3415]
MKKLKNKHAFVTGGSRGIGAGIALRLAREGANVTITYQHSAQAAEQQAQLLRDSGARALALRADSNDPQAVRAAVQQAVQHLGTIDILVNNAGIAFYDDFMQLSLEQFELIVGVNIRSVFVASQAVLEQMQAGGRIIHIGSCQANRIPHPGGSLYAMTKSALAGLTKGMARDLGPRKITVNIVHPGPVDTDMNPANGPMAAGQIDLMALDRFGSVEDIAALVAYLAGAESGYVTGAEFTIDGGTNC